MSTFGTLAEEYFSNLNPIAARIHADIVGCREKHGDLWEELGQAEKEVLLQEGIIPPEVAAKYTYLDTLDRDTEKNTFHQNDLLSFFHIQCGRKVIRDDQTKFRDEHSSPFSFHTRSQLDLCSFDEIRSVKQKANKVARPITPPILKSELVISHSKVVSELKNALRSSEKFESKEKDNKDSEFSPKVSKLTEESCSGSNFISKLIGNKRNNKGTNEEREHLVSPERQCQIVASSDNFFKTNFHSSDTRDSLSSPTNIKGLSYRSNSGLEESHALLAVGSCKSADTESSLCDTDDSVACSLPKTGLDFLDNW